MTANDTNRLYSLKMTVVVVEARIEAREIKLDARASNFELPVVVSNRPASTRLPTPLNL